ncbi:hypothetical protein DF185_13335 [Marinifilum breve]|uniref:Uncharacterized protein n=2 Tax=Marinifilum breve TaxID=2184082 RepID=A0A2V3ZW33_9BACT|nr:hypothetical protein DF185_13335 [Marinifilum breve]
MKLNENDLAQKILSEEEILAQKEELRLKKEQELADSLAKLPKGFLFESVRKTDAFNPPIVIDIANRMDSIKEFKLSDIAQSIEYIKMQTVPNSSISNKMDYRYYMTDKYIVASNIYGIHLFNKDGSYKNTVVKNELSGVKYDKKKKQIWMYYANYTKIGGNPTVWSRGDKLYYNYQNTNTGQNYIMELNCSQDLVKMKPNFNPEEPKAIIGMGKVLFDMNHGQDKVLKAPTPLGVLITNPEYLYERLENFNPDNNTYIKTLNQHDNSLKILNTVNTDILGIFNSKGDTLSKFKKHERLINYKHKNMRGFDFGLSYEKQGNYFFRTDYNDTIFKVIPPNIIQPKYVFNLGKYKVNKQDATTPSFDLHGKMVPYEWADGTRFIFMSFLKDNNLSPKSMRNKTTQLYFALYSKQDKSLFIVERDPYDYQQNLLVNNIDGGFPVWPKSYMINRNGEIMLALRGKDIKEKVASDEFKNSKATYENKQKLIDLAANCKNDDQVLMLVK